MGLAGLLQAGTALVAAFTNFGLSTSAIKNIAASQVEGNDEKVGRVIAVFRRLVWATGLLGLLVTLGLSSHLSQLTFGNKEYTWAFALLSITLLIDQISSGQEVLLRATRQLKLMAKSSIIGSVFGLLTTIPLYYLFGIDGIVPALVVAAFTSFLIRLYFVSKLTVKKVNVDYATVKLEGKKMLIMGFIISLSGSMPVVFSYFVRIFISNYGSIADVGLYNAGFAIVNTYVGMIFTAMGTDYYPRLSEVAHSNEECQKVINQQSEIAILILAPVIMVFLVFINWVVIALYSTKFITINEMIQYVGIGMFFKTASWSIAFIFLSKGASKLFFWNELVANIYILGLNLIGYYEMGLTGLGLSFTLGYFLYFIQVYIVSKIVFKFSFNWGFIKIFSAQFSLILLWYLIVKLMRCPYPYSVGVIFTGASLWYTLMELDRRIDLKQVLNKFFKH